MEEGPGSMRIDIVELEKIYLLGVSFYGAPFAKTRSWSAENEIGILWKRFMDLNKTHGEFLSQFCPPGEFYEVHIDTAETADRGFFEIFVGVKLRWSSPTPLLFPPEFSLKTFAGGAHARITLLGEEIKGDWYERTSALWDERPERRDYEILSGYGLQFYDKRFKGLDRLAESELDAYLPLRKIK